MSKIRVLVVDDHAILRTGLRMLINMEQDMEVVGEAINGQTALKLVEETKPEVAIVDITMPGTNSIELIAEILKLSPDTRILVLTMHCDPVYVRSTVAAGALGYITKETADSELLSAIRSVFQGKMVIDQSPGSLLIQEFFSNQPRVYKQAANKGLLSERERVVLQLLAQGYTSQEIATRINIGVKTVDSYRANIGEKLGLHDRADFTNYASKMGLLNPENLELWEFLANDVKKKE